MELHQSLSVAIFFFIFGLLGLFTHVVKNVRDNKGSNLGDLKGWISANQLSVLYSLLCYLAIVGVWLSTGVEFFGWTQGALDGSLFVWGFSADSAFKSFVSVKTKDKVENTPVDQTVS